MAAGLRSRRGRHNPRRRIGLVVLWLVGAVVVFLGSVTGGLLAAPVDFTPPGPPRPVLILDRSGKLLGEIVAPEQRTEIPRSQMPAVLRNAVVAAEDKRFFDSGGVDPVAIGRAALSNLKGNASQGGSTITQQYVKNVYVGNQHSYTRKLKEAGLAVRLEQRLSKDEILTRYLNVVYFGNAAYGVEAASEYYFGVHARQLDLARASMLAGLLPAPTTYNPVASLTLAKERQKYVLDQMVQDGYTDAVTASNAYAQRVPIVRKSALPPTGNLAPEFVSRVAADIKDRYAADPDTLYRSGVAVRTTLDLRWQQAAQAALQQVLPKADDPEAAVVVVDYKTGDLLALANKTDPKLRTSDPAELANRTSGSTIKPFTLATALENGDTLDTYRYAPSAKHYPADFRAGCNAGGQAFTLHNDEGGAGGYSLRSALAQSVNTVYGPLAIDLGTAKVAAVARAAGMTDSKGRVKTNCAMGLGVDVTPLNEAYAFATLANGGVHYAGPRRILSISGGVSSSGAGGRVIARPASPARSQAMPRPVADQVVDAMRDVVSRGTARAARQPDGLDVFGKTGTTDDETDAWFTGCIPAYSVCVTTWMGYSNSFNRDGSPHTMRGVEGVGEVFGGTLPAKIFATLADGYRTAAQPAASPAPAPTSTRTFSRRPTTTTSAPVATSSTPRPTPTRTTSSTRPTPTAPTTRTTPASSTAAPPTTTAPNPTTSGPGP